MTRGYDFNAAPTLRTFTYNADNKPISITLGGATTTLTYDGDGGRAKKVGPSGITLYIGQHYEIGPSGPVKYVFAGNQRVAKITDSGTYYFHGDHLNSAAVMTNDSGSVVETTNYQPFGSMRAPAASYISNFKFTDQELDPETGLYYYGARYYDPAIGRFISADTIVPDPADPQSMNRYTYVRNSPLIYTDPTGHFEIEFHCSSSGFGSSSGWTDDRNWGSRSFTDYATHGLRFVNNFLTLGYWGKAEDRFYRVLEGSAYAVGGIALGVVNVGTMGGKGAFAQLTSKPLASWFSIGATTGPSAARQSTALASEAAGAGKIGEAASAFRGLNKRSTTGRLRSTAKLVSENCRMADSASTAN